MPNLGGVKLVLGGREFVVPPLSLRQVRSFTEDGTFDKVGKIGNRLPSVEELDVALDVIHAALKRSYPDLGKDELLDLLDVGNLNDVMIAVCQAAGFEKVKPGEAVSPKSP